MPSPFKINVGSTDRILRLVLGLVLIALALVFRGSLGSLGLGIGVVIGLVLIVTGALRICPAYLPLGLSTCHLNKD